MKKTLLLGSILLLSSVWAVGQSYANKVTVDGYLSKSGGIFNLADETSGTTYQLSGDAAVTKASACKSCPKTWADLPARTSSM
jgi:hypothetical protein